jgi:hypothetical protein
MSSPLLNPVMTLVEYYKGMEESNTNRPYIEMFAKSSDVMQAIPFATMTGAIYTGFRQSGLPQSLAFRGINGPSTSGAGTISPYQEASYVIDHDIPLDVAIIRRAGDRRRAMEETNGIARAGELWIQTFLKGDNSITPTAFNGLLDNSALVTGAPVVGGAPLSLFALDQAIWNTKGCTHIIADWSLMPRFIQAARNTQISGFVIQSWPDVGAPKMTYANRPILFGYEKDLHPTILPFTEVAPAGGAAVTSSVYTVNFSEQGVHGIQLIPLEVRDMGLLPDGITYNTHISWDVGLVDDHQFSFTRLAGITSKAFTA